MRATAFLFFLLLFGAAAGAQSSPLGAVVNRSGATITGVTFRVWAPNATSVAVRGEFSGWTERAMTKDSTTGYWTVTVAEARPNQEYKYFLHWAGNTAGTWKQDPRAVWVRRDVRGILNSVIYDHSSFDWGGVNRPSIPVNRQVMYELHIGSFYDPNLRDNRPATFDDASVRLDYLQRLGVNVIALMPVNEFGGDYSWGYNPHYPYAIEDVYGGPDGLKRFIKAAHQRGMKVQIDVVHNHWLEAGVKPEDSVWQFDGPVNAYFFPDPVKQWTPWGPRPDYDKPEVRRYIQDHIKLLLDEFRVDGFRWDSPQNILGYDTRQSGPNPDTVSPEGKSMVMAVNRMIHEEYPGCWSIAEDADLLAVRPAGDWYPQGSFPDQLRVDDAADSFDGHWQTSFHNEIAPQIASASPDVGRILAKVNGWSEPPGYRVIFADNHDKSGDLNNSLRLADRMDPGDPGSKTARRKTLLNAVLTLTAPGTPMLWMGQEFHATGAFSDAAPLDWRAAFGQHRIFRAHRDLVLLRETLPALRNSDLSTAPGGLNEDLDLVVYWRRSGGDPSQDVVVLVNFSGQTRQDANVPFPSSGTWHVRMNTDWRAYGADFGNAGPGGAVTAAVTNGYARATVTIAPHSAIIFARSPAAAEMALDDADGNGLPDGWEAMAGVSDPGVDEDNDGIGNAAEFRRSSDPLLADRLSLVGSRPPLAWSPDDAALRMIWSDPRQSWEWTGSFTAGALAFKFVSGPGWAGSNYGTGPGIAATTASTDGDDDLSATLAAGRYRFTFSETDGAYTVQGFPVSAEWWETRGLPAPWPATADDPRWANDSDRDGFSHRLEYALGGNPTDAADGRTLQTMAISNSGGTNHFVFQWLERTDGGSSLAVIPQISTNLSAGWVPIQAANVAARLGDPLNHQRREVTVPFDGAAKFLRLRVTGP